MDDEATHALTHKSGEVTATTSGTEKFRKTSRAGTSVSVMGANLRKF